MEEKFDFSKIEEQKKFESLIREEKKVESRIQDFLELSKIQQKLLKEKVEKNKGIVRVFIRKDYEKEGMQAWGTDPVQVQQLNAIDSAFQRMLLLLPEKTPPIILFEEQDKIPKLIDKIKSIELMENEIYVVPTYLDSSEPKLTPKDSPSDRKEFDKKRILERQKEDWKVIIDKLKVLGVKKILIGGMWLVVDQEGKLNLCVGNAASALSNDFEVEISSLNFPHNRKEIKKFVAERDKNMAVQH